MALYGIDYLVGVAREEDELRTGAVNHQPQWNLGVMKKTVHEMRCINCSENQGNDWHTIENNAYGERDASPCSFVVKV